MQGLYQEFKASNKENEGITINDFAPNADGSVPEFTLAYFGPTNKKLVKAQERITRPYQRLIDNGKLPDRLGEELNIKLFVHGVLLGWKNMQDADGKDIPFSREAAIKLFTDLPHLRVKLQRDATNLSMFRDEELEEQGKN